jgi:hypothetical protein
MPNDARPHEQLSEAIAAIEAAVPQDIKAVVDAALANAVGLAMHNIVAYQQALNTINIAVALKALSLLVEKDPVAALDEVRRQRESLTGETVNGLAALAGLAIIPSDGPDSPERAD